MLIIIGFLIIGTGARGRKPCRGMVELDVLVGMVADLYDLALV